MAFAQRLDMRQGQQLVMTPQLQQAIKMLQMSNLELADYIKSELERNPLLETAERGSRDEPSQSPDDHSSRDAAQPASDAEPRRDATDRELADDRLGRAEETFDTGAENLYADEAQADRMLERMASSDGDVVVEGPGATMADRSFEASAWTTVGKGGSSRFEDLDQSLDGVAERQATLRDHLHAQLATAGLTAGEKLIVADLIEQLDDCGYLRVEFSDIADRLGADIDAVRAASDILKGFEPAGVGAADLQECLALQLIEQNRYDPAMATLLANLPMVAKREQAKLMKLCGVDADDMREMIAEIRALDPKPGLRFDHDIAQTVTPDVFVYENRQHGWSIELNAETLPRLLVNNAYAAEVKRSANGDPAGAEIQEFVAECQQSANWLLKSIDQRAKTILKVASEIVRQQDAFLAYGVSALKPLNLKSVAEAIDMHESTVSRVTSNKYVSTPRGVFELKYFFTPAIASTDGDVLYSAEAIRHRIRTLIDAETPDDVLSDDRIVAILRDAGVDIARRTVAKYREAMKIPSSVQRRKSKAVDGVF